MKQIGTHWTNFDEIRYLSIFGRSIEKIQASLKCRKNKGHLTRTEIHTFDHTSLILLLHHVPEVLGVFPVP